MDRSDPDTIVMVGGIVITLLALAELYPLLTGSDDN
jgi:preprotein translocase subunit Sec61beta